MPEERKPSAHVIVLGSLLQSPRILFHARSLAQSGWSVTLSGYHSLIEPFPTKTPGLSVISISPGPDFVKWIFPNLVALMLKFFITMIILTWHLMRYCRSDVILLQNPPGVPAFVVVYLFSRLTGKQIMIDWHNYGYTLMGLGSEGRGLSSRLYKLLELNFATRFLHDPNQFNHFCVSAALQQDLAAHSIRATVLYDRPSSTFCPTSPTAAHELLLRLSSQYPAFKDPEGSLRRTRFTEITALPADRGGNRAQWRKDRPALVVSSCSWTPDDDFMLVIDALDQYDQLTSSPLTQLPNLLLVVTGRGPLKAHYSQLVKSKGWSHVEVLMPWLEWSDYPVFLGCADVGISVHRSSSGLDLPMKVVDLIGVHVPVLSLAYPALSELIPDNQFGLQFSDAPDLCSQLQSVLRSDLPGHRVGSARLTRFRQELQRRDENVERAEAYWRNVALPVFEQVARKRNH